MTGVSEAISQLSLYRDSTPDRGSMSQMMGLIGGAIRSGGATEPADRRRILGDGIRIPPGSEG